MDDYRFPPLSSAAALHFINNVLGIKLWSKQQDIVRGVFGRKKFTVVRSCHAAGKTLSAAGCSLAWLFTGPKRVVLTTAPTARQVSDLLWKEIRVAYKNAARRGFPLGGYLPPSANRLRVDEDGGWMALGFASDESVNVHGYHGRGGTLVVLDEAAGVPADIWDALQGVVTGSNDRVLAIGNPTMATGPFFEAFKDETAERIVISALDSPNVKAGKEVIPGLVTKEWVEDRRRAWGEGSALFRSRVLGEFPEDADNLVPLSWVEAAFERWEKVNAQGGWPPTGVLGVDIARYGEDFTCAAFGTSAGIRWLQRSPRMDLVETAGWVMSIKQGNPAISSVRVDSEGMGAGVFDLLTKSLGDRVTEMRGGTHAEDSEHFANRRAEWFWGLRCALDPSGTAPIALPYNRELLGQLPAIRWSLNPRGQIIIESKDAMKARGMHSPDEADSVAYALAKVDNEVPVISVPLARGMNMWSVG